MAEIEILLPKMGESVAEATVIKWLVEEGASFDADDAILEIATDNVDSEVPAPEAGILKKMLCQEGDVVAVGQPVAIIETEGEAGASAPAPTASSAPGAPVAAAKIETEVQQVVEQHAAVSSSADRFYSPLVKNIAQTENISQQELDVIQGTGLNGRVTKDDILGYVKSRGNGQVAPAAVASPAVPAPKPTQPAASAPAPAVSVSGADEIVEMDRMRKLIADHMVMSKRVSPHVSSFVEVDVTNIVLWRDKVKDQFLKTHGEKLTYTPIFFEAIARVLREMPGVNVSVQDDNKIVYKKNINLGMAAALPSGNLIVPVIKNADSLNLVGLCKSVNDLAARARANKLAPDEIQGGTYTVSNVGTFGNVFGTPIINQPQAAILALGAIKKKPAVIETPAGDTLGIRHFMFLSHSYDHRVIDGALGGTFIKRVGEILESFDLNRPI